MTGLPEHAALEAAEHTLDRACSWHERLSPHCSSGVHKCV